MVEFSGILFFIMMCVGEHDVGLLAFPILIKLILQDSSVVMPKILLYCLKKRIILFIWEGQCIDVMAWLKKVCFVYEMIFKSSSIYIAKYVILKHFFCNGVKETDELVVII